jgi:hypothetical protein
VRAFLSGLSFELCTFKAKADDGVLDDGGQSLITIQISLSIHPQEGLIFKERHEGF